MTKNKLKNLKVTHISLVKRPANNEPVILKNCDSQTFELAKFNDELRVVYGIVYAPDIVDLQNDFTDAATIREASYDFMKGGRNQNVDLEHSFEDSGAFVSESWIVKETDSLFPSKQGAWAVGIHVPDTELWDSVKKGKFLGLSLAGTASREEQKAMTESEVFKQVKDTLEQHNSTIADAVKKAVEESNVALKKTIDTQAEMIAKQDKDLTALKKELIELTERFKDVEIQVNKKGTSQGGSYPTTTEQFYPTAFG